VVARLGGDEFVALATCGPCGGDDALACAARTAAQITARLDDALAALNTPADEGSRPWRVALGVGTAVGGPGERSLAELMTEADAALYERKRGRER
jgi:GGDEF domain-containing protein